jgi:hypothetical protein
MKNSYGVTVSDTFDCVDFQSRDRRIKLTLLPPNERIKTCLRGGFHASFERFLLAWKKLFSVFLIFSRVWMISILNSQFIQRYSGESEEQAQILSRA